MDKMLKKRKKDIGYNGCRNCQHQIDVLRTCKWMEQGGDGALHLICPRWERSVMDELISRQAAIDSIMEEPSEARYPVFYAEKIEQLPSAQITHESIAQHAQSVGSVEEVIERLRDLSNHAVHTLGEAPFFMSLDDGIALREAIDLIKALPSAQQWIPVTERLPEDDTIVLVTFSCGKVGTSSWHEKTKYNNGFDCFMNGFYDDGTSEMYPVTAWMPLPKPWEGGDSDGT